MSLQILLQANPVDLPDFGHGPAQDTGTGEPRIENIDFTNGVSCLQRSEKDHSPSNFGLNVKTPHNDKEQGILVLPFFDQMLSIRKSDKLSEIPQLSSFFEIEIAREPHLRESRIGFWHKI